MESVLSEVNHPDDIGMAVAAGFTFIHGDAVAALIQTPGNRDGLSAMHIPARPAD